MVTKKETEIKLYRDTLFSFEGANPSGGDSKEDPPVPMPNTEVKLLNVDDTWRETARESRKLPESITKDNDIVVIFGIYSSIAQLVEHLTLNQGVPGSSP